MKGDNKCSTYHAYIMIILEITFFYQNFIGRFFFFFFIFYMFLDFFCIVGIFRVLYLWIYFRIKYNYHFLVDRV